MSSDADGGGGGWTEADDPEALARECPADGCTKTAGHTGAHTKAKRKIVALAGGKNTVTAKTQLLEEAERIVDELQADLVANLAAIAPLAALKLESRAEINTKSVITLANDSDKILRATLRAANGLAVLALVTSGIGLLVAVGVEIGWIAVDGRLSSGFELDELADRLEAEQRRRGHDVASNYMSTPTATPQTQGGLMDDLLQHA